MVWKNAERENVLRQALVLMQTGSVIRRVEVVVCFVGYLTMLI